MSQFGPPPVVPPATMVSPMVNTEPSSVWMLAPPAVPSLLPANVSKRRAVGS